MAPATRNIKGTLSFVARFFHSAKLGFMLFLCSARFRRDSARFGAIILKYCAIVSIFNYARLAANIPFIRNNHHPLSFVDTDRDQYLHAILQVYEFQNVEPITELFVSAYKRSAEKYTVISQSIGQPDPFRLKYRQELKLIIAFAVRESIPTSKIETLADRTAVHIPVADLEKFHQVVNQELSSLHEGNIARYRLRPSEFYAWKEFFEKNKT